MHRHLKKRADYLMFTTFPIRVTRSQHNTDAENIMTELTSRLTGRQMGRTQQPCDGQICQFESWYLTT